MKESKADRFKRVAEARVNKIIKMVRLLGNCSNTSTYSFDNGQVEQIFIAIETELEKAKQRYSGRLKGNKNRFKLSTANNQEDQVYKTIQAGTEVRDTKNKIFDVSVTYDGIIGIEAENAEQADEKVRQYTCDEMYEKSDGTWDIGDVLAEHEEE